jgi:hypothetical protein
MSSPTPAPVDGVAAEPAADPGTGPRNRTHLTTGLAVAATGPRYRADPGGSTSAPPPRHRRRRRVLAVAAVVGALVLATASTEENEPSRVDDAGATSEAGGDGTAGEDAAPDAFAVGDLVELGDWRVQVHGITDPVESTSEFLTPSPGNRWVAADVEVTNTGTEPQTVSSIACFEIADDQNRSYTMTITADPGSVPPDGEVAAGSARRGTLTYEVPAEAAGLRLSFKCDLLSTGSATIALG